MRKTTYFFLTLTSSITIAQDENDLSRKGLRGNVKTVSEMHFKAVVSDGMIEKGECAFEEDNYRNAFSSYNDKGNLVEKKLYLEDGKLDETTTYTYDKKNRLTQYSTYDTNGTCLHRFTNEISGNRVKQIFEKDGNSSTSLFKLGMNQRVRWKKEFDRMGALLHETKYKRFLSKKVRKIMTFEPDTSRSTIRRFKRSNGGLNVSGTEYFMSSKHIQTYFFFTYDRNDQLTERIELNSNMDTVMFYRCTYNDHSKLLRWHDLLRNVIYVLNYDDYDNIVEDATYYDTGEIDSKKTYRYEYDETGNWIRKIVFDKDSVATFVVEREIEYY